MTYRIVDIHRNRRHPGHIYARLVDADGTTFISATLDYILDTIKERGYKCENVFQNKYADKDIYF
jgi:hypothetical protein